jgi:hypothetical protein
MMLVTVLQQDCGVHYNLDRIEHSDFRNSKDLFIHGIVEGTNGGTCVSLPVLYAAVGRRLGYPLQLAVCKGHLFCRWDSKAERFDIECTGSGFKRRDDAHFTHWPHQITDEELKAGIYLKSLTGKQELALFMATRGHCLLDNQRTSDAVVAYALAHQLYERFPDYLSFLAEASTKAIDVGGFAGLNQIRQKLQRSNQVLPTPVKIVR